VVKVIRYVLIIYVVHGHITNYNIFNAISGIIFTYSCICCDTKRLC